MTPARPHNIVLRSVRIITGLLIVAGLYFAREVLIPVALALLLTFLLQPPVRAFIRLGMHRALAVIITVLLFTGLIIGVGVLVGEQVVDLSLRLPDYRQNLREKVRSLRPSGEGAIGRLSGTIQELQREFKTTQPTSEPAVAATEPIAAPMRVEVVNQGPSLATVTTAMLGPVMVPLVVGGITWLLMVFLLLYLDELHGRLLTYAGMRRISLTTTAMNEISLRVGRFVRMQLTVNLIYGTVVGIGLACFGVPQALLWGVLGFVLRFAPYIGPWLAATLPILLSAAVFQGWGTPVGILIMFVVIEALTNLVLEPLFYGSGTGITSLGVVVASVFWAWVWGPVGLLLAVPVSVCLTVMGKYVPQLSFLYLLFGENVTISTAGQLYQSLLVGDEAGTDRIIDQEVERTSLIALCDDIILPVLSELKHDLARGAVDPMQARRAGRTLDMALRGLAPPARPATSVRLYCISGNNEVDQYAAKLLLDCCRAKGVGAEIVSPQLLVSEGVEKIEKSDVANVVVIQVAPVSAPYARRLLKAMIARLNPDVKLINLSVGIKAEDLDVNAVDGDRVSFERTFAAVITPLAEQASVDTPAVEVAAK